MSPSADVTATATDTDQHGRWLSLGPASRLLGVDPDTLRRWADDGRVAAWTTPGGHRRFERRMLERLAAERRPGATPPPLASLGASPARLHRVYRQHFAGPVGGPSPVARDAQELEAYRRDGRRLVDTLIAYLDASDDESGRAVLEARATTVVDGHAARLARNGVSLTEAVSLFVTARQPFLAEIAGLARRRSLDPVRLAGLYGDASAVLDRLLLRFVRSHQGAADEHADDGRLIALDA